MDHSTRLPAHALRWHCDETQLDFTSTAELDPAKGVLGQPIALAAMRFGVECDAPGQNIYVRGLSGTGRMTLVRAVLEELDRSPISLTRADINRPNRRQPMASEATYQTPVIPNS